MRETKNASETLVRLAFLGDIMLGRMVSDEVGRRAPASFWGDLLPELRDADAVLANLECAISARGHCWSKTPKVFFFRALPQALDVLRIANVRYVSLANNHVLDYGEDAFRDTISNLDAAGILHSGAGESRAEAARPARLDVAGLAVSVFAIVDHETPFGATADRPGTCLVDPDTDADVWPDRATIAAERAAVADLVIVSAHLGPNMILRPSRSLRDYKHRLIDAGADILHGHSAHVFQGIEAVGRSLILHDTGDVLDDYAVDAAARNDWSFLFFVEIGRSGVRRVILRPVVLGFAEVGFAKGAEFEAICARMRDASSEFGTILRQTEEGLVYDVEQGDGRAL